MTRERTTAVDAKLASAKDAFVTVGGGRGFLVETTRRSCLVVTAAHCLPFLPPAHPASESAERTYSNLLGPIGELPTVWAECLFVDPIADVAVLGEPDGQILFEESEAYERFVEDRRTLRIGKVRQACPAWLLTLDGQWEPCTIESKSWALRYLSITNTARAAYAPGTSGSPIVAVDGRALGVVSVGPMLNPVLASSLPGWLIAALRIKSTGR